ncbi:MAG TPA: FAD-dependent oxidoreductase [Ignavibacteria bacterium]|nr:FAD-dependent oxidoreductase [Ignavibacteria bacterium]
MREDEASFLNPSFNITFQDFNNPSKLKILYNDFLNYFKNSDEAAYGKFISYRDSKGEGLKEPEISQILIDAARIQSRFIGELFNLTGELEKIRFNTERERIIFSFKKEFIQRIVFKKYKPESLKDLNWNELDDFVNKIKKVFCNVNDFQIDEEYATAKMILEILEIAKEFKWFYEGDKFAPENFVISDKVRQYANKLITDLKSQGLLGDKEEYENIKEIQSNLEKWSFVKYYFDKNTKNWVSYFEPHKVDFDHLVHFERPDENFAELIENPHDHFRERDGFSLNDHPRTTRQILNQVDYCMYCHEREKDSCSTGYKDRFGAIQKNPLGVTLYGCPLNEKISESHLLRKEGFPLASFSIIMIDNPMCPGTGHRICNDCMKGCVFQKQEPVNIPLVETSILKEILALPYGFEIYSLLSRWNPLNIENPIMQEYNSEKVLVVGAGPAGYTMAHYLLNLGYGITMIDELSVRKIYPEYSDSSNPKPVKNYYEDIYNDLNTRDSLGFGGASEYGITVRWDKNFLNVIYINLMRHKNFRIESGKQLGSDYTIEDAWNEGYKHIAMCVGAAKPNIVKVENANAEGVFYSTEFLSNLQIRDAINPDNDYIFKVKLPGIIIGGGLTAIDCSTELLNYYPVFLEKLFAGKGKDLEISDSEMLLYKEHYEQVRREKELAKSENRMPKLVELVRSWGGVKMIYRKRLNDAPSYRENHEEIIEALEQGVDIVELFSPVKFIVNESKQPVAAEFEKISFNKEKDKLIFKNSGKFEMLPAGTIVIAAGTNCNDIYNDEHPATFEIDPKTGYYVLFKPEQNGKMNLVPCEKGEKAVLTSYNKDGKFISIYGDSNSAFSGSVVKAMASAKFGAKVIDELLKQKS